MQNQISLFTSAELKTVIKKEPQGSLRHYQKNRNTVHISATGVQNNLLQIFCIRINLRNILLFLWLFCWSISLYFFLLNS